MRFLVDNQLPRSLSRFLSDDPGHHCEHVLDLGLAQAEDVEVWSYAGRHGMVVVSKDEDFVHLAMKAGGAQLLWVRLGNCRTSFLIDSFRVAWPKIEACLQAGDRVVELR